jgi:hypothetical protein
MGYNGYSIMMEVEVEVEAMEMEKLAERFALCSPFA